MRVHSNKPADFNILSYLDFFQKEHLRSRRIVQKSPFDLIDVWEKQMRYCSDLICDAAVTDVCLWAILQHGSSNQTLEPDAFHKEQYSMHAISAWE